MCLLRGWRNVYHCVIQVDPLTAMGSLNLAGSGTSHTPNMQGFPTPLSSAFSNPQSPAKAFSSLTNPNPSTAFGGISSLSSQLPGTTLHHANCLLFLLRRTIKMKWNVPEILLYTFCI